MLILRLIIVYAVSLALMALVSVVAQIPFDAVAGGVLIVEIAIVATLVAVAIVRRAGRKPRTRRASPPVTRVDAEVVEPAQSYIMVLSEPAETKELTNYDYDLSRSLEVLR